MSSTKIKDIVLPALTKFWAKIEVQMNELNENLSNKITALEEAVMSNATASEIFENARQRLVNSALGKALGMTADTGVLDAAIDVENVEVCSDAQATTYNLDTTNKRIRFYLPKTGFWKNTNHVWQSYANLASLIGLSSDKLVSGNTILGINGSDLGYNGGIASLSSDLQMEVKHSTSYVTQSITCPANCEFAIGIAVAYSSYGNHNVVTSSTSPHTPVYAINTKNSKIMCVSMRSGDSITSNNAFAESNTRYTNIVAVIYKLK